jgi:hypothetical protein
MLSISSDLAQVGAENPTNLAAELSLVISLYDSKVVQLAVPDFEPGRHRQLVSNSARGGGAAEPTRVPR